MKKTLKIEGMTCKHCVMHVEKALRDIPGVQSVKVDLALGSAVVEFTAPIANQVFQEAVEEAGYSLTKIGVVQ